MSLSPSRLRPPEAVYWSGRLLAIHCLAMVAVVLSVPGSVLCEGSRTGPVDAKTVPTQLQRRLEDQRAALQSANPPAIIEASEKLAALALRQMGQWRTQQKAYPQAIELYRDSLLLEDSPETRADLAAAEERAKHGRRRPGGF